METFNGLLFILVVWGVGLVLALMIAAVVFPASFIGGIIYGTRKTVNHLDTLDQEYRARLAAANALTELGFLRMHEKVRDIIREVEFSGKHFTIVVGRNWRDGQTLSFRRNGSNTKMPSPSAALVYFARDVADTIGRQGPVAWLDVGPMVRELAENRWLLDTTAWMDDPDLLAAIDETNVWVTNELKRLPEPGEWERHLNALRPPGKQIPV